MVRVLARRRQRMQAQRIARSSGCGLRGSVFVARIAAAGQGRELSPEQQAAHVLSRLTFGPRAGDLDRVLAINVIEARVRVAAAASGIACRQGRQIVCRAGPYPFRVR